MIKMKNALFLFSVFFIIFGECLAQQTEGTISENQIVEKPRLVVGLVVDQMRYDYLSRFSEKFGTGGFNRLLSEGFSCDNNYINYVPTNTAPGHASIYTGTTPSNHGILSNAWLDPKINKAVYCVGDRSTEPVGTGNAQGRKSPKRLLVPTLGDYNRTHTNMIGKTISISLKDRAAVLSGGHKANAAYWFRGKLQGHWITSSYYMEKLPKWVMKFNDSDVLNTYVRPWNTLLPMNTYTESGPDDTVYERGFKGKEKPVFPYNLELLAPENGDFDLIRATPFGNSYTLDFAAAAIAGESLGKDDVTDMLLVSLSSTDYIGHNFGVDSKEIEDAFIRLDRDIERFMNLLDQKIGKGRYTLFLTSDHGANRVPHLLHTEGLAGGYFKEATVKYELIDFLKTKYGNADIVKHFMGSQVYLNHSIIRSMDLKVSEVEETIQKFLEAVDGVKLAVTRSQLTGRPFTEGIELMVQNGFNEERSGDIFYILDPSVVVYAEKGSSHGSPYEFDTHVPLIFYGCGIKPGSTEEPTNSVDIAPTISTLLNIPASCHYTGSAIREVVE